MCIIGKLELPGPPGARGRHAEFASRRRVMPTGASTSSRYDAASPPAMPRPTRGSRHGMSRLGWALAGTASVVILGVAAAMVIEDARDELDSSQRRRTELCN